MSEEKIEDFLPKIEFGSNMKKNIEKYYHFGEAVSNIERQVSAYKFSARNILIQQIREKYPILWVIQCSDHNHSWVKGNPYINRDQCVENYKLHSRNGKDYKGRLLKVVGLTSEEIDDEKLLRINFSKA